MNEQSRHWFRSINPWDRRIFLRTPANFGGFYEQMQRKVGPIMDDSVTEEVPLPVVRDPLRYTSGPRAIPHYKYKRYPGSVLITITGSLK